MTAKEILNKHTRSNGCRNSLQENPFLEQAILNAIEEAMNFVRSCETLKDNRILTFDGWCKIKNIHHSFDDYYLWDTTLLKKKQVLQMYRDFINNL